MTQGIHRAITPVVLAFSIVLCPSFANPAAAETAAKAAQCAAFNYANWDYEVEFFSEEDRSPEWKEQARGFERVALRLGMTKSAINADIRAKRSVLKKLVTDFVFLEDPKTRRTFNSVSRICNKIIQTAPEMEAFR